MAANQMVEVTALLAAASCQLSVGQLLHGESFSLYEAMSAIEVGNPKMDAGVGAPATTLEQRLQQGAAPTDLSNDQMLAIIDKLMVMEASWHSGNPLAQTIYTCLYVLQPARLRSSERLRPLAAYCAGIEATTALVKYLVLQGSVCEEEDINSSSYGLPLPEGGSSAGSETAALAALDKAVAALKAEAAAGSSGAAAAALLSRLRFRCELLRGLAALCAVPTTSTTDIDLQSAAAAFKSAAALLPQMGELCAAETAAVAAAAAADGGSNDNAASAAATSSSSSSSGSGISSSVCALAPGFDPLINCHLLGPAPPRQVNTCTPQQATTYYASLLTQLSAVCSLDGAVDSYRQLQAFLTGFSSSAATGGRAMAGPLPVARSALHRLLQFRTWQALPGPPPPWVPTPGMIATAIGLSPLPSAASSGGGGGKGGGSRASECAAHAALDATCYLPSGDGALFIEQAVIAVSNWVQAMLLNRGRQRRRLRRGLEDWSNLYQHATNADFCPEVANVLRPAGWSLPPTAGAADGVEEAELVAQGPLATWVEKETAGCMVCHLLLGYGLCLYSPSEYDMVYWYCDFLLGAQATAITGLGRCLPPLSLVSQPKGGGKATAKARAAAAVAVSRSKALASWMSLDLAVAEAQRLLCQGLLRLMAGLKLAGHVPGAGGPMPFNTALQRFDQRFAFFHTLSRPEPLSYSQYEAAMDVSSVPPDHLYRLAADVLDRAKRQIHMALTMAAAHLAAQQEEQGGGSGAHGGSAPAAAATAAAAVPGLSSLVAELKDLQRVALQNVVAAGILVRTHAAETSAAAGAAGAAGANGGSAATKPALSVSYDFSHHPSFPALVLKGGGGVGSAAGAASAK